MLTKLFFLLFGNNVDAILADFHKVVSRLEKLETKMHDIADAQNEKACHIRTQAYQARQEAIKASKAASKVKELLGD